MGGVSAELAQQVNVTQGGKAHYAALDGLRGVAALMVVLYHQSETMLGGRYLQHANLAVDFFFILSGFVISYAYSQRLTDGMSRGRFAIERAIRLYPLLFMGALVGAAYGIWFAVQAGTPAAAVKYLIQLPFAMTTIPIPFQTLPHTPWPLNVPEWSLFYEIIANIVFAVILFKLSNRHLALATVLLIAVHVSFSFVVHEPSWSHFTPGSFAAGVAQVMSTFSLGMLMQRVGIAGRYPNLAVHIFWLVLIIVTVLAVPIVPGADELYKLGVVFVVFPVVIAAACQKSMVGRWSGVATLSGAVSYPIYILHNPLLLWIHYAFANIGLGPLPGSVKICLATAICLAIAWVADLHYDQPLRRLLKSASLSPSRVTKTVPLGLTAEGRD